MWTEFELLLIWGCGFILRWRYRNRCAVCSWVNFNIFINRLTIYEHIWIVWSNNWCWFCNLLSCVKLNSSFGQSNTEYVECLSAKQKYTQNNRMKEWDGTRIYTVLTVPCSCEQVEPSDLCVCVCDYFFLRSSFVIIIISIIFSLFFIIVHIKWKHILHSLLEHVPYVEREWNWLSEAMCDTAEWWNLHNFHVVCWFFFLLLSSSLASDRIGSNCVVYFSLCGAWIPTSFIAT